MSHLLLFTFRKLLNTFIYTARNDPLLANAHGLFQESPTEPPQNVLELTLTILGMSLNFIVRNPIPTPREGAQTNKDPSP